MRIDVLAASTCVLAVLLTGCGSRLPPTVKLGGTVTLDGKPLDNAVIVFYPADKDGASPVSAPIADGRYVAALVPKGTYRVAFRSIGPQGGVQRSERAG